VVARLVSLLSLCFLVACDTTPRRAVRPSSSRAKPSASPAAAPPPSSVPASPAVPRPSEQRADVRVEGRTSTLQYLDITDVGSAIPQTHSGDKVHNTPGFRWWVSKHFALKSDLPERDVRLYLELVELAWPHYVEAFGGEPPGTEERRIALVYGSNWDRLREAMLGDGFRRGAHAGGETMFFNRVAYSFPTSSPDHRRYIVVHEAAHAFQMARTGYSGWAPTWFVEGIADAIAHHVFDPEARALTVSVFDRAPQSWLKKGLARYEDGQPGIATINANPKLERELNFLLVHYLRADPIRAASLAAWRDALALSKLEEPARIERSEAWLASLLGPDRESDFRAWVEAQRPTLETDPWTWEQDGDALWFRNREGTRGRVDVNVRLNEPHATRSLARDYPLDPDAAQRVDLPEQGAAVGFEIDYRRASLHRGRMGWGLGRAASMQDAPVATIWIERADVLEVDTRALGGERRRTPLPLAVRTALREAKRPRASVRVRVTEQTIETSIHAYDGKVASAPVWRHRAPIEASLADALREGEMAMLAEGASHAVRPVLRVPSDPHPPHPARRDLERLAGARLILGTATPEQLRTLETRWVENPSTPERRRGDRWRLVPTLLPINPWAAALVAGLGPPDPHTPWPGVTLSASADPTGVEVTLTGPLSGKTTGTVWVEVLPSTSNGATPPGTAVELAPFETKTMRLSREATEGTPDRIDVRVELDADGEPLELRTSLPWPTAP